MEIDGSGKTKKDGLRLKNQTGFPVYLCAKQLYNRYNLLLEQYDITYTQMIVMMYLWEVGESNVKEASESLLLDPSTLTPLLKRLESKGYISRERAADDERNLIIRPTGTGYALKNKVSSVPYEAKKILGLSEDEEKTLRELIYKALDNIERNRN